jgi:serine/threonine protein kinase
MAKRRRPKNKGSKKLALGRVLVLNPGDKLDEFKVGQLLGEGLSKMAKVYTTERGTALKVYTQSPAEKLRLKKFEAEAKALERLKEGPNIVKLITPYRSSGKYNGQKMEAHYYTMEKLDTSLDDYLVAKPDWSLTSKLNVLEQIADGLIFSHQKNTFHRDLYTPNVLLGINGEDITAKICDFGSAKLLGSSAISTPYFIPTGHLGYSSPEACSGLLGSEGTDAVLFTRADIYSFGLMVYEVIGGTPLDQITTMLGGIAQKASRKGLFDAACDPSNREIFRKNEAVAILEKVTVNDIVITDDEGGMPVADRINKLVHDLLEPDYMKRLMNLQAVKAELSSIKGLIP